MQNLHKYYELEISYSYNTSLTNNYDCDPISFLQWAFGVTCWEVFSGGKVPYPAVDPVSLVGMLQSGYRADKPNNAACTDAMYVPLKNQKCISLAVLFSLHTLPIVTAALLNYMSHIRCL